MNAFRDPVRKIPGFKSWENGIKQNGIKVFTGLSSSAKAHFAYLFTDKNKIIYIAANELKALGRYKDLCCLCDGKVLMLPEREDILYDVDVKAKDGARERMKILAALLQDDWDVLVLSIGAALQYFPNPEELRKQIITLKVNEDTDMIDFTERLADVGYLRVATVEGNGQFSLRGDIIDIFPSDSDNPYRIEFFGDTVDSIRTFDVLTQRTNENVEEITIMPDSETGIQNEILTKDRIRRAAESQACGLQMEQHYKRANDFMRRVESDLEKLEKGARIPGYDRYLPFIIGREHTVFSYAKNAVLFVDNKNKTKEAAEYKVNEQIRICEAVSSTGALPAECFQMVMSFDDAIGKMKNINYLEDFGSGEGVQFEIPVTTAEPFPKGLEDAAKNINENSKIIVLTETEGKAERAREYIADNNLPLSTEVMVGGLENGFSYPDADFTVISGKSFFKKEKSKRKSAKKKSKINSFTDINVGDIVVHDIHGVGRYEGTETIEQGGTRKDYIKIVYADDAVIYVPTYQLETVQKFIGQDGKEPKLNKMGGADWARTTQKVKDSLREYAKELAELYAKRSKLKGHAFQKDNEWQRDFENGFEYTETEDQLKCVEEIKADMELPRPMERLLCGDVGYGKTEVALRAAFKAVCEGKQVAFLVPTTVLARQHYKNFVERFKDFPVKVDYICRFRTPAERKKVIEKANDGSVDILVGTHSIIQKSIKFKDLGLLVIDEEQRFGVMHKEKLKELWPSVDILTLSATPIPRTLHMSLSGIRDISVLEEPPTNRTPVQTFVSEISPEIIKNAVYREMGRQGQVFYLYNRVRSIAEKKMWLNQVVPEARVGVAHGQMTERELEDIMEAFLAGEYDILLCTTIIESGLDMPNVNTIIVEDSDRLGLAQLYQIRGRVGRSSRTAYAYLTYKRDKNISETAEKRLRTIREFTEFGSGFKIALRDLEIRGAGSVLGERQHGKLAVVGYDMYCKLLSEVVAEELGEEHETTPEVTVNINVNAYIPSEYIEDDETRLDVYRKISMVESHDDMLDLTDELIDRFGDVPKEIQNLMQVSYIRYLGGLCGFGEITTKLGKMIFLFDKETKIAKCSYIEGIMLDFKGRILLNAGTEPYISLDLPDGSTNILQETIKFLEVCNKYKKVV